MKAMKFSLKRLLFINSTKGFTLLELLIAISISFIVIVSLGAAVVGMISANRESELKTTRRVELNRALDYISEEIKGAKRVEKVIDGTTEIMRIKKPDNSYIDYYFYDLTAVDAEGPWVKPGTIRRKEYSDTDGDGDIDTNDDNDHDPQTLVDGITKTLPTVETGIEDCEAPSEFISQGGFYTCIDEKYRTVSLYLFGTLGTESKVLLVSSKFVTRNIAPRGTCIVPNLVGQTASAGNLLWTEYQFTGNFTREGTGDFEIVAQSIPANETIPCNREIKVSDSACILPNYENTSSYPDADSVLTNYNTIGFENDLVINGNSDLTGWAVYHQSPSQGTYPCSTIVTINETSCTIPDFTGKTFDYVYDNYDLLFSGTLIGEGLSGTLTDADLNNNTTVVGEQSLPPGTYPCSSDLTVSEPKCTVPNLIGLSTTDPLVGSTWNEDGGTLSIIDTPTAPPYSIGSQNLIPESESFCSQQLLLRAENTCTVPNLTDSSSTDADSILASNFFSSVITEESYSSPFTVGSLKNTTDSSGITIGSNIPCNTPITLVEKTCNVDSYIGQTSTAVPNIWNSFGGNITKSSTSAFTVGGQSLTPGTQQTCSKPLELSDATLCTVPNLIGQNANDVYGIWTGNPHNFTTTPTKLATGDADLSSIGILNGISQDLSTLNFKVFYQSLTPNENVACSSNIEVGNNAPNFSATTTGLNIITDPVQYNYKINLAWDAVPGATQYKVYACPSPINKTATSCETSPTIKYPTDYPALYTGSATSLSDKIASFSTNNDTEKACYSIQAIRPELDPMYSVVSPMICLTNDYLNAPSNLQRTVPTGNTSSATVNVTWNAVNGATSYKIYRCTDNNSTCTPNTSGTVYATVTTTSYTNTGVNLDANKNACYTVVASDGSTSSTGNNTICAK